MRAAAAGLELAVDAARDVVARQQFRRTPRVLVALRVAPAFFLVVGGLLLVVLGDVAEHEPLAGAVAQDPAFAAHALGDEDALHARRPDHPRRMELHELHVDQRRAGAVGQRMAVAGAFPAVAGDAVGAADAAGGEDHRLGAEEQESSALAFVSAGAGHAAIVGRQIDDGAFHVDGDAGVDGVILEGADQLEARAIADVREARIAVPAEVALQDAPVGGPVEDGAPRLELAHAIGRLLGVDLGHPPVVDVLAAAHRVGEVHLPVVAIVDVGERRRDAAFGHHRVRLAEQRLADQADRHAGSPPPRWPRAARRRRRRSRGRRSRISCRPPLQQPPVGPDARGAQPHVDVCERDGDEAAPRPRHVPPVEARHAVGRPRPACPTSARRACRRPRAAASGSRACSRRAARR